MATPIRTIVRKLLRRPAPTPATPTIGERIQQREREAAKLRLLQSNRIREYRWPKR